MLAFPPSRTRPQAVLRSLVAPLSLLVVTGCTASETPPTSAPVTEPAAATQTPQPAGAIRELSKVRCSKKDGVWSFKATLSNTGKAVSAYTVTVAIAKTDGGTVVGQKAIKKTLEPGKSASISAKKIYAGKEKAVSCVPLATKAEA